MKETALLFDNQWNVLYRHAPKEATSTYIPDSSELYGEIIKHKDALYGIAHSHPLWVGNLPSNIDRKTMKGLLNVLGRPLLYPILVTGFNSVATWTLLDDSPSCLFVPTDVPKHITDALLASGGYSNGRKHDPRYV
jgi:hypothetical protein